MKTNQKLNLVLALLTSGALLCGCGTKQVTQSEVPQEPNTESTPVQKNMLTHYKVKKHDTLWAIAGKSRTYRNPFEWPLIFKANRDLIQDPDLIYPSQVFKIEKKVPSKELEEAKKLADETPRYQPHDKPVKKLSVDYF